MEYGAGYKPTLPEGMGTQVENLRYRRAVLEIDAVRRMAHPIRSECEGVRNGRRLQTRATGKLRLCYYML